MHNFPASTAVWTWTHDPRWSVGFKGKPTWEISGIKKKRNWASSLWTRLCGYGRPPSCDHEGWSQQAECDRKNPCLWFHQWTNSFSLCMITGPYYVCFIWIFYTLNWKYPDWSMTHIYLLNGTTVEKPGQSESWTGIRDFSYFLLAQSNMNLHSLYCLESRLKFHTNRHENKHLKSLPFIFGFELPLRTARYTHHHCCLPTSQNEMGFRKDTKGNHDN